MVYMIFHYLNFLKDVLILTSCIPLDALTLNCQHEMEMTLLRGGRNSTLIDACNCLTENLKHLAKVPK
jgi:hypothetical protein